MDVEKDSWNQKGLNEKEVQFNLYCSHISSYWLCSQGLIAGNMESGEEMKGKGDIK